MMLPMRKNWLSMRSWPLDDARHVVEREKIEDVVIALPQNAYGR